MGRIRTIKPELFLHEELFDAEKETGLPLRLAFIGMFTQCDKAGRFEWRPRTLKSQVFPFDELDFSRVLDALVTRGFLRKYKTDSGIFGCIPTWKRHQFINAKEKESELPEYSSENKIDASFTREERVDPREGEGYREGKDITNVTPSAEIPEKKLVALPEKPIPKTYGNPKVKEMLEALMKAAGVSDFKETKERQRQICWNCVQLAEKLGQEEFVARVQGVVSDDFKQKNCNSLKYLYGELKSFIHSPQPTKTGGVVI